MVTAVILALGAGGREAPLNGLWTILDTKVLKIPANSAPSSANSEARGLAGLAWPGCSGLGRPGQGLGVLNWNSSVLDLSRGRSDGFGLSWLPTG